jgi:hypothetical protein
VYMRGRNRRRFFSLVHRELEKSGISRLELSNRMGRGMDRVSHLLAAPGNWTLDTLQDLLFSISGAEPKDEVEYPLDRPARNSTRPEWLSEPDEYKWIEDQQKQTQTQGQEYRGFEQQEPESTKWTVEKTDDEGHKRPAQSMHSNSDAGLAVA